MYLPYCGIGSRQTPSSILPLMGRIGFSLANSGFTLRSGGAAGADSAFEAGTSQSRCPTAKEIFLPWEGFLATPTSKVSNAGKKRFSREQGCFVGWPDTKTGLKAQQIAASFHPAWDRCSQGAKLLHARNVSQVLGRDLKTPSKFVVCWTQGAKGTGGTGQALRIAKEYGIPIFDLGIEPEEKAKDLAAYCEYLTMPELAEPRE